MSPSSQLIEALRVKNGSNIPGRTASKGLMAVVAEFDSGEGRFYLTLGVCADNVLFSR